MWEMLEGRFKVERCGDGGSKGKGRMRNMGMSMRMLGEKGNVLKKGMYDWESRTLLDWSYCFTYNV